ncbi:MAG: hypothetical protein IJH78_07205 [Clostridia bacterium]|nr:hypothetical protein [Clostridia bacterium]
MAKRTVYTYPISRTSLYFISTFEIYAVFACTGGIATLLLLLDAFVKIIPGKIPPDRLGRVPLAGLVITSFLLLIGYFITQGRTIPPYRYYRKHGVLFPACLKGKRLTCKDREHYIYCDDTWFVAAMTLGSGAICADLIDFDVPVTRTVQAGRMGNVSLIYHFRTKDGSMIHIRLGREIKPFKKWVLAHGGSIGDKSRT